MGKEGKLTQRDRNVPEREDINVQRFSGGEVETCTERTGGNGEDGGAFSS